MKKSKFNIRQTIEIEGLGKITASQGALNNIAIALAEASKAQYLKGYTATAEQSRMQSRQIYAELKKYGLYK